MKEEFLFNEHISNRSKKRYKTILDYSELNQIDNIEEMFDDSGEILSNMEAYYPYEDMVNYGWMSINTNDITKDNWEDYLNGIVSIMQDGIDTERVQSMYAIVTFFNGEQCKLFITDLYFNVMYWGMVIYANEKIQPYHLFFNENITKSYIKNYCDMNIVSKYKFFISNIGMCNILHKGISKMSDIDIFSYYLANTYSLNDDIKMMEEDSEVYDMLHLDISKIPFEDIKDYGMTIANKYIEKIKNSDHCLSNSLRGQEATNPKQFKEQYINIGTKPNGLGGVFPFPINTSYIAGGVNKLWYLYVDSSMGVTSQIISKNNVGSSGHFSRLLSLNNRDSIMNGDPNFVCGSRNFQKLTIVDDKFLSDYVGRYYRLNKDGIERKIKYKDKHLIGKTIYLRSPMTCASEAQGEGICFRCYGDLAYTNCDINIGEVASQILASLLTQRLLSAKHLLESRIKKLNWAPEFLDYFDVFCNTIIINPDNKDMGGHKLIIDCDDIESILGNEDSEECAYGEYITTFYMKTPTGDIITMTGEDEEGLKASLYPSPELNEVIGKIYNKASTSVSTIEIDLSELEGIEIFKIEVANDELSQSLDAISRMLNRKKNIQMYDRHQVLQEFLNTIRKGGLDVNPVHCELILSNQIRSTSDILIKPDWTIEDVSYNLIALSQALRDNPSLTVALSYQNISKAFYNPLNFRKRKPSCMDLVFTEKPQMYMDQDMIVKNPLKPDFDPELLNYQS